jgi:hypothetical protein
MYMLLLYVFCDQTPHLPLLQLLDLLLLQLL